VNALLTEPLLSLDIYLAEQYRYAAARAGFVQAQLAVIAKLRLAGDDADHELAYALLKRVAAIALKSQSDEADPAIVLPQLGLTCLARGELADALSYLEHWYGRVRAPNRQADAVAVLGILYVRRWLQSGQPKTDHDRVRARRCLEEAATKGSVLAEPWLVYAEELWTGPRPSTDRSVAAPVASH
jgi:ATP/maltotriose-dependent transcriptional regulator MalT